MDNLQDISRGYEELKDTLDTLKETLRIEELRDKVNELEQKMLAEDFWDNNEKATSIIDETNQYKSTLDQYEELKGMLSEISTGIEMLKEIEDHDLYTELSDLLSKATKEERKLVLATYLSGKYDKESAIISINAGAGGTEAQDWADILLRMYTRYAQSKGYGVEVLDILKEDKAGISSATLLIKGTNAYGFLKAEKGVHRLVRISPFDSAGKRHTSFASVDVYPQLSEEIDVELKEEDLRIDTYRASGAGGQHVNVTDSAVRITHIPTGIVVQCQNERSQTYNREQAMKMLVSRLIALAEEERKEEIADLHGDYSQIAWGSQIRSYVLHPYSMVKDHRTNVEKGDVDSVLDGDLDDFITSYLEQNVDN